MIRARVTYHPERDYAPPAEGPATCPGIRRTGPAGAAEPLADATGGPGGAGQGPAALDAGHGGGQPKRYTPKEQARILQEVRREPDRDADGTATWSLSTLQRALRRAPDGLPGISTYTIWGVLHEAGVRWGKDRSWCTTGTAVRKRKSGTVQVTDPDAVAKKT